MQIFIHKLKKTQIIKCNHVLKQIIIKQHNLMQVIIQKLNQIITIIEKHILLQIAYTDSRRHKSFLNFFITRNLNAITKSDARYYTQTQSDNKYYKRRILL